MVTDPALDGYFHHHGHRTAISQPALQAYADPLLGYTELDGVGYVVSEVSPSEADLDWGELTEPTDIIPVIDQLSRATARVHCVSDSDSDHSLVPFQTEEAITAVIGDRDDEFIAGITRFARGYSAVVRDDHRLFVEAFRNDEMAGVRATENPHSAGSAG